MTRLASLLLLSLVACGDDDGAIPDLGPTEVDSGPVVDATPPTEDAPPADTWANWAQGFFATYCVECHDGGARDYRTIDEVLRDRDSIRCGVSPTDLPECGAFPPPAQFPVGSGPKPSDADRERLVAWLDAGAPE